MLFVSAEARGDPVEDAVCFDRRVHRIVLVEGLYLLHRNDGKPNCIGASVVCLLRVFGSGG